MDKICTSIEQSKKLIELGVDVNTADMYYQWYSETESALHVGKGSKKLNADCPAWSFSALFDILPDGTDIVKDKADTENEKYMCTVGIKDDIISTFGKNPVDACVEMISKLHELNLLKF